METITCCECGIDFEITDGMYDNLLDTGKTFYCPNGHPQYYADSTKVELERMTEDRNLYREQYELLCDEVDHLNKRIYGYQGYVAKLKKRIANE